jgi:protein-tyrosine phosphatase
LAQPMMGASALIHELVLAGWMPVVAHPEFIPFLAEDLDLMDELVVMGARAQATAMSVTGKFGRRIQANVREMIDRGLVHFVASDTHSSTWRPPGLSEAHDEITRRWGRAAADRLTSYLPAALIEGHEVPLDPLA